MGKLLMLLFVLLLSGCPTEAERKAVDRSLWISSIVIKCSAKWDDESIIKFRKDICTFYNRDYPCQFTRDDATKVSTYLYNDCFVKEALKPINELAE